MSITLHRDWLIREPLRDKLVEEIQRKLGDNFIVSEPWEDSQQNDKTIGYVVVRIDKLIKGEK